MIGDTVGVIIDSQCVIDPRTGMPLWNDNSLYGILREWPNPTNNNHLIIESGGRTYFVKQYLYVVPT